MRLYCGCVLTHSLMLS
uniref:Uncharacterized protein n=1 Tax=Rhizophora mucronata TaxID=61149 RepID=A0A2P2NS54_RHIMU